MPSSFDPPSAALAVLWGLWLAQALWCWFNAGQYLNRIRRADWRERLTADHGTIYAPPAVLIVAVKGGGERFERHIDAICRQRYPRYRIIFTVESEDDPACAIIKQTQAQLAARTEDQPADDGPYAIDLLVAGHAQRGGQKVHNLIHAVRSLDEEGDGDQVGGEAIVFTDADTTPPPHWMRRLVHPLRHDYIGATTGYRWLIPAEVEGGGGAANLPTRLACVINASIATLQGPPRRSHAWGGSTAIRRDRIDRIKLLEYWDGALSDDYQLTRAVKKAKLQIRFVPRLLLPSEASFTWRSLFEFGRRQYLITRVYAPGIWLVGLLATGVSTAGWVSCWIVVLWAFFDFKLWLFWAGFVFLIVNLIDDLRLRRRRRLVRNLFEEEAGRHFRVLADSTGGHGVAGIVNIAHFLLILASALGQRITWAGITYRLRDRRDVVIEDRKTY